MKGKRYIASVARVALTVLVAVGVAVGVVSLLGADLFWFHHTVTLTSGDEHTQYALLAGRSGGQVLIGGTSSSDELRLAGGVGAGTSCLTVQSDGTIVFTGDATVWDDIRAPATAINPPGQVSDPDWDNTNGGWLFDPAGTEILYIILQFPHSYKEGSNVDPHVHWMPTNTQPGSVLWRIEYKWTNIDGTDAGATTDVDLLAAADGTALKHQLDAFGRQTGTSKPM